MRTKANAGVLPFAKELFSAGQRVAVAVSGGADSVALLRVLHGERGALGVVLSAVHVHHGLRGEDADADLAFAEELAMGLAVPLRVFRCDVRARAAQEGETMEEAARVLRYGFFRDLLAGGEADVVATAHTLDDQAETVLMKLIRGAWTEGLGGIHPVIVCETGRIVRPLLGVARQAIERYLLELDQRWREDATNADPAFTRNRVRHQLLPLLREFNPGIATQLARMSAVARAEEDWWQGELARVMPGLLMTGKPVRGGGRATSTHPEDEATVALEVQRLRSLHPAVRRRVLREAAKKMGAGVGIGFDAIESLLTLAGLGDTADLADIKRGDAATRGGRRVSLPGGLIAERTPRELRFSRHAARAPEMELPAYDLPVPGSVVATEYGLRASAERNAGVAPGEAGEPLRVRVWQAGDRVRLRYSRAPKKVAEALERMRVFGPDRERWPVVVRGRSVLWLRGAEVDPAELARVGIRLEVREEPQVGTE